jgi:hypothetical protein
MDDIFPADCHFSRPKVRDPASRGFGSLQIQTWDTAPLRAVSMQISQHIRAAGAQVLELFYLAKTLSGTLAVMAWPRSYIVKQNLAKHEN